MVTINFSSNLRACAGSVDKKSKTQISHTPCYEKIRKWRNQADENALTNNDADAGMSNLPILTKTRPKKVDIEIAWNEVPETDDAIKCDEGGVVRFNRKLVCLASIINFVLDDAVDAESRVTKAIKAMGAIDFI